MTTYGFREIEDRASELRERFGAVDSNGYVDLEGIVHQLGGRIEVDMTPRDRPESLIVYGPGDFTILVPVNTSKARDRFTVAHELGHLVLHDDPSGAAPRAFYRYGQNRQETEANAFAGALVMPADSFRSAWGELGGSLPALAVRFGVSRSAAGVRSQVLHLS